MDVSNSYSSLYLSVIKTIRQGEDDKRVGRWTDCKDLGNLCDTRDIFSIIYDMFRASYGAQGIARIVQML
jgi:hypothetical protein